MKPLRSFCLLFLIWKVFGIHSPSFAKNRPKLARFIRFAWFSILIVFCANSIIDGTTESFAYATKVQLNIFTMNDLMTMNLYRVFTLIVLLEMFWKRQMPAQIGHLVERIDALLGRMVDCNVDNAPMRRQLSGKLWKWISVYACAQGFMLVFVHIDGQNFYIYFKFFTMPFLFSGLLYFQFQWFVFFITWRVRAFRQIAQRTKRNERIARRCRNDDRLLSHAWAFYDYLWQSIVCVNRLFAVSMSVNLTISFLNVLSSSYYAFDFVVGMKSERFSWWPCVSFSLLAICLCFCFVDVVNESQQFNRQVTARARL